jgi:uncharacterized membrane protein YbhN (UPF0104 family)
MLSASRGRLAAVQAAVSVGALAGVIWWFSRQDMPALPSFGHVAGPLAASLALYAGATLLRGERWHRLLGRGSRRADAYALTTVGYMGNNALPARAGDVMKAMLGAREAGIDRSAAFGALVAERLLDAVALALVFAVVVVAGGLPVGLSSREWVILAAVAVVVVSVLLVVAPRVRGVLVRLLAPSRGLLSRRGAGLLALSVVLWGIEGSVYAEVARIASVRLSLSDGLYVMAIANLAAMIPAAPGYVGTYDAAVVLAVRLAGAGSAKAALPYVVLVRFVLFVPITLVGLVALVVRYGGLRRVSVALRRPAAALPAR